MWSINSLWFEVAVVSTITTVGSIFFGQFEEQTPKWRKVLKLAGFLVAITAISAMAGRVWAFAFLAIAILFVLYIHAIWLPKKGINGWTAEPRDKYYELRGWKKKDKPEPVTPTGGNDGRDQKQH
jgi:hypothetical protein